MFAMLVALVPGISLGAVTADDCQRHRDEFIASLEENRRNSVREIDAAASETNDPDQKALLEDERNQAWEFEEQMRATGDQLFRDCMTHVEALKSGG